MPNHQRLGSISNAHAGQNFEDIARVFIEKELNIPLYPKLEVQLGITPNKTSKHKYDLGSHEEKIIIECKSHNWTRGDNTPSAKLSNWDKEMYYFHLLAQSEKYKEYRKIFFIQRFLNKKRGVTLGEYYIKRHGHIIPRGIEIWEYDVDLELVQIIS